MESADTKPCMSRLIFLPQTRWRYKAFKEFTRDGRDMNVQGEEDQRIIARILANSCPAAHAIFLLYFLLNVEHVSTPSLLYYQLV